MLPHGLLASAHNLSLVEGITEDDKVLVGVRKDKHRSGCEFDFQGLEAFFSFVRSNELLIFLEKVSQCLGYLGEAFDESAVITR